MQPLNKTKPNPPTTAKKKTKKKKKVLERDEKVTDLSNKAEELKHGSSRFNSTVCCRCSCSCMARLVSTARSVAVVAIWLVSCQQHGLLSLQV